MSTSPGAIVGAWRSSTPRIDPLVPSATDPQSYNAYAYARNNPVSNIDPTGACIMSDCGYWYGQLPAGMSPSQAANGHNAQVGDPGYLADVGVQPGQFVSSIGATSSGANPGSDSGGLSGTLRSQGSDGAAGDSSQGNAGTPVGSDGLTQYASNDPHAGIEEMVVHGEAPHKGFFETLFPPFLSRTLGRFGDGLKDTFIGLSHIIGGVASGAMFLITAPVIGGVGALTGEPGVLPRMFGESVRMGEFGGRMVGAGLERSASGLTGGWIHVPLDPVAPPNRFE